MNSYRKSGLIPYKRGKMSLFRDDDPRSLMHKIAEKATNLLRTIKRMPGMEKLKFVLTSLISLLSVGGAAGEMMLLAKLIILLKRHRGHLIEIVEGSEGRSILFNGFTIAIPALSICTMLKALIAVLSAKKAMQIYNRNKEESREMMDSAKTLRRMRMRKIRHNDLIAPLVAGMSFKAILLPILISALKAGVTAGVAGGISSGIIAPIINRIKGYGFSLLAGKVAGSFSESIIEKIKNDVKTLIGIFKTRDPLTAQKLMLGLNKFDAAT